MANVKVAIRVRPLNSRERVDGGRIAVQVEDKVVRVRNVKLDGRMDVRTEAPGDSRERLLEFPFDYCYWSVNPEAPNYASQEEVFQDLGMCVLTGAAEGYNVCLFAYGQTGSGKTYTMMGNPDSIGLTPRICQGLFRSGIDSPDGQTCRVEVSFLEIYNERVRDLLRGADQKKPVALRVREHPEKGPYVQGLTQHVVEDYKQAADLLEAGIANRITAATHVHDASSRSHAIFSIQYTQAILENNLPSEIVSKINLVDLAGSERADPNYCRDRITEGANINKSLVTLGIVISALAQNSQMCSSSQSINSMLSEGESSSVGSQSSSLSSSSRRHCFIPYRDSVLTWLLKDSLGGNSKTIMIATISPSCSSYSETLSTLRYAAHAKNIVNKPRVNEDASVRLIRDLREEIDRLKSMLLSFSVRNPSPSLSDERDSSLSDIVLQNELKIEQLTKDWSESWQDKRALLEQYSVDINQDRAGVQIHSLQPHLISLEPDVLSTGVTIYHLREGITKIGPQDPNEEEPHIDIPEGSLCEIENQNGVVTLKPRAHTICMVNNRQVTEPCRLAQGAVITLAGRQKYRFNHPAEAAALRERRRIIDCCPLNALMPNSRAEEVGSKEASDRLAPWKRLEENQRYVECLREEILVEQRRAERDLEREQAHLCKQHSEIQQWILQEKQRLAAIREKGTLDSGVQTDIIPLPALTGINENESSRETIHPLLIVGDRKRVVQEELLKHHALRRNENRIRRKRLRYQLERIARKRHLLEAKQGLQRLETALSLGVDAPLSPDIGPSSKGREHPMMLRRHSFSVDLLSRLYPQHAPIFSQFLRRNRLSESTSSLSSATFPRKWVSDEYLPGKTRGRSNTMPSRCSQGTSIGTDSSENIKMLMKENVPSEEMTERKSLSFPLQSSIWNHNISVKSTMDSDTRDSKKVLPIIKQSSKQKNSPNGERSSPNEVNKGLETIRKALSRSVGFGIKKALSRVFRKPSLGSRGGKGAKSASRSKTQFAVEGKKDKNFEDMATKQPHSPIKSTVSCDGLDQLISSKEKKQGRWHSAETLNKNTRRWVKMQQDLTNWVENNGDEVADDSSDCDSLFSVDSLSSAYAIALAEQLQQEDCEPSEAESVESQMSKDSLVKESSGSADPISALKRSHSICHTFNSSPIESKEMIEEIFRSQKVTRQEIKESSHFSQITSDSQHHSDASIKETEAFLALTDAWSSTDPADSPRILGALELKRCILSDTSSSQSQASLELSGVTTGYECQIPPCFDSTQGKDVTVKERSHISFEREMVLDYFLSDRTSTSCSTPECTLLQGNNEQLNNLEALSSSVEASITQNTMSNDTLCANKPTSPSELALLETSVVDMLAVNAPFQDSAVLNSSVRCLPDKSPDKGLKSNFENQTELVLVLSNDESVFTKSFAPKNNLIESKTHSEESCISVTPFRDSNIFSKCDGQTLLELQHSHSTLQSEETLKISNKFTCSNKDLHQSAMQSMNIENDFLCKPQSLMVNHDEKKVSDEKSLVLYRVQSTETYSESYDARNSKDYPFLEINVSDSANKEVSDFLRDCDAVMLEHESCNIHSRKRSKDIQDDLAGNLKTPKRSCVESLVSGNSAVNNVPFMFNDSRGNSTGKLLPVEKDITDNLSQTFQQVSITASMDGHIEIYQNNNNPAASFTSEDRPVSTGIKVSTGCPVGMQNLKGPDLKLVDSGMFDSSTLRKISHAINDKISEVVKEHLKISLQVESGEVVNKEPETNSEKSLTTSIDALTKPQNKNEMTAEDSLRSSHTSQCVTEYCADDRVNVDNTNGCVRNKYLVKNPTEKKVIVDQQGVGFHGSCPSLVKNISAEIENLDTYDSYGPAPQDLKINVLEATTVLLEGPTDNHLESLITSHSNGPINEVTSESNTIPLTFPLTLISACKQNPEVILSSENVTVAEEQDQFFLMKTKSIPSNISPEGPSAKTEYNGFNLLSHTKHEPVIYPEVNSISGVSKDSCVVTVSTRCSEALVDHVDHVKEAVKTVKASKVNLVAKFQQVVELNNVAHLDTEAANQFQMKNEHSFHSDGAENDSSPLKKLAYQECAGEKHEFSTQEQLHVGQNTNSLNEAKDKIMDLENHNCLGKPHEEPTVSKSGQALAIGASVLQRDNQTQIIQSAIMNEKPSNCLQKEDESLCKKDHMQNKREIQEQCVNVQKERKNSNQLQSHDAYIISKSVQKPEQRDMTESCKSKLNLSPSRSLNAKEHQGVINFTDATNGEKQHTTINGSRLVFSRTKEEGQKVKPKRYRKAHFTAPLSSSTDSTPDSSLDETAKSRVHKCGIATPNIPSTPAHVRAKSETRNSSSDESSTSLSLQMNAGSLESNSNHNQCYGPGSKNPYPYVRDVTTVEAEEVRHLTPKLFKMFSLSKDDEMIHSTRYNSAQHISHENNNERANSLENDSLQNREPILHFGSSDINPFVYTRKKDRLLTAESKNQAFGSAVNISSQFTSLESSRNGIARCCSMDNGLNVQNSPFSSHLSTYAVQKGLSSTLSSAEGSKEHFSTEAKLRESFHTSVACNNKVLTASGSDSCNDTFDLASSSGQVDEIMLVYSSEHENQEIKQDSRKCDHGTQTVKVYEDVEKKCKHKRSSTQVLVPRQAQGTSTAWTSLQNMSEHLSELIVNTSDLLGNIQCMRTGESSMKKVSKIRSDKYDKSDSSTQTATDVGIQTEGSALLIKQNKVLQRTSPVKNPKSHEVNVIVKVIGSEVCNVPKQECATKSIRDEDESRQSFETIKSMPDLRPGGSPSSEQFCRTLDTVKNLSLETVGPNQYRYNPVTVDHKASETFGVCAQRKCTSQVLAKDNQIHMKPNNYPDKRVLLIDRASSPILTVDVTRLQKRKIKSGTIHSPTEILSKTTRNPPENKSVSSMSFENLRSHSCVNAGSPDAYSTEASPSIYVQNGRKKPSQSSKVPSQEMLCSPLSHSHSSAVKHRQPVDLSHNTLSSTPINHSRRSSMQEYKHRVYKEMSCWSDLSKDTFQYQEEDSMSLALSDCNTEVLVSINPLAEISPPQEDYWIPENLPMHNKFTNWSGISQQPPDRLTNQNNSTVGKSPDINRHSLHLHSAESESLGYRYKPDLPESIHRRTREIERLRKEREQVLASMQLDLSPHPLSVELKEAKLHYGLGKTDTLLTMLKSSARTESTISTKQQLYDRHRRSIDGLRREREDRLQTSRRARSLSPSKHPNSTINMTEQSQRAVAPPSRQREHLQQLRKEVVEMCRVPNPPRREGQYPTDIELLLRDYSRAREEAKTEIAKARVRLRERTEQEKRRLEQQALSHSVKDHLKLCTRVSNSTLCTGSNLSLSSGPTSGYNSGNAALLKDGTSPSIQVTGVSGRELKVRSRPPMIPSQSLQAPRAWLSAQDIRLESSSSGYELHSSSPSSPPGRQRTCSFSSHLSVSIPYQDIADCTLTSAISEVHLASGGDVRNLLAGKAEAGWRHQGLENQVQTFYRPSSRPSSHGFLGAMELERPLASLWSLIRDHSKAHLYNKSLKSTWTRLLDDTTQLVYLLTDPSNCHMKQPRDFCCLSIESKQDDMWVLAMQSVFEESLPRPSVDTVRGEMFPSAWILQHSHRQGREIVTVIYLLQVDLGTPTLPQRLVNEVARKQAAVIADLDSFLCL
ncbi:stAR-related lipid transfer protein 9 isoform X1 [Tachysurus fulvidraco]|uniref:stAR-related lipid transfer protein 9 isoform X1 n=3 Tax=Tachysurus fulvidraco TaxID=1234273 RepID=UPI001FED4BD3|nr:stAR-related lipid transfer protein 9 isoform X1 [Tachysurus fulvidraco]